MTRTDGKARTKNRVAGDLAVHWFDSGPLQVASSKHEGWYDIGCDAFGNLTCACPDWQYRYHLKGECKHTWEAAQYLETHAPLTPGQRLFAEATARDRGREALRIMKDYKDDHDPWPGAGAAAGGAHTPEQPDQPEESEGPAAAIATNPSLEDLFE